MTEKRFELTMNGNEVAQYEIIDHNQENLTVYNDLGNVYFSSAMKVCELLNELHEENEYYKSIFFELVETALTDKNCRELYCKGILDIFDKANSLNQARDMIKEHLE